MSLVSVRDSIVSTIKDNLTGLKTCVDHPGRFNLQELKRVSNAVPAVYVASLGYADAEGTGRTESTVAWAAYVVTRSTPKASHDTQALVVCNALTMLLDGQDWDNEYVIEDPEKISGQNLYSTAADSSGVSLWAVTWRQKINLGNKTDLNDLFDFTDFTGTATDEDENTLIETAGEIDQE